MEGAENSLTIETEPWSCILSHTLDHYPEEACGILLRPCEKPGHITMARPAKNATLEYPARRYLVDPREFLEVDKWADENGLDICGFYHSHPDQPSSPSEYDRKTAWEGYLYLIISIRGGTFNGARAWILGREGTRFHEVTFESSALESYGEKS